MYLSKYLNEFFTIEVICFCWGEQIQSFQANNFIPILWA